MEVYSYKCPVCDIGIIGLMKAKIGWYGVCNYCSTTAFTYKNRPIVICECADKTEGKTKKGKSYINYYCRIHKISVFIYPHKVLQVIESRKRIEDTEKERRRQMLRYTIRQKYGIEI